MLNLANTQSGVSVLRGTATDGFGDVVDTNTPVYQNIPAAIVEGMAKTVMDQATQTPRTIRPLTCMVPYWADVLNTDRIQDASGTVYIIEAVTDQPSLGYPADKVLTLKRITGTGP